MASIQYRDDAVRVLFRHHGKQLTLGLGKVTREEAEARSNQVDYLLLRLKQGLATLPSGVDIVEYMLHDGRHPERPLGVASLLTKPREATLGRLRDRYLEAQQGALEANTLATAKIHLDHLVSTLGEKYPLRDLTAADVQRLIDRRKTVKTKRGRQLSPATIKKEIAGFRAAWNWGVNMGLVDGDFPSKGLVYPKTDEKPPFMTRAEIERVPEADRDEL